MSDKKDMLAEIFLAQRTLDERIYGECSSRNMQIPGAKEKAVALFVELGELLSELQYKWWKDYSKPVDLAAAREELSDILHFLVSLALDIGMDAEMLFGYYMAKNKVNHSRQDIRDEACRGKVESSPSGETSEMWGGNLCK